MDIGTEIRTPSERDRILQAMTDLCAEQGYAETTIDQVITRARVSPGEFARYFGGDKEECMVAAVNAIIGEVMSVVSSTYSADRSEWDSGLLGMKAILELMAANPGFAHLGYVASRQMGPPRVREAYLAVHGLLASMIDRLRQDASVQPAPANAALASVGGGEAIVRREIVAGRLDQLPRLLPDLAYGATVAFLGQEESLRLAQRARRLLEGTAWA